MKKKNWYRSLSLADDKYVAEADPNNAIKFKRSKVYVSIMAACACFALLFCNLWLFIPFNTDPPDVSQYADSEYYGLIQKLNVLTFEQPKYKNNAQRIWRSLQNFSFGFSKAESDAMDIGNSSPTYSGDGEAPTSTYQETTDNQVEGVIEADLIKRSDTHIYYLDKGYLRVFSIDKENTKDIARYDLNQLNIADNEQCEFYLSSDCKTVTLVTVKLPSHHNSTDRYVRVISLDVSDPRNIVKKEEFSITGNYMSSRITNGSILLLTEFVVNKQTIDFDDETTFIPQIDEGNGPRSLPASSIVYPDNLFNTRYTVVIKLDEKTLDLKGTAAYLSYSEDVYVSESHVFLTNMFADKIENSNGTVTRNTMTEISCLSYGGDSFERKGSATVRGYVKDKWSMDEYNGILRVFTTTNATTVRERMDNDGNASSMSLKVAGVNSNASLYCIDLSTFETVASVIDFAPFGDDIRSARFDKNTAYACTAIEVTDPVFFFDLSDLNNITVKDTGTIEGFSTSLINLGNGYLLGIGRESNSRSFKVEVYEETENGVRSVCSYKRKASYSDDYKSYYVDRQNQLIGVGIVDYNYSDSSRYILLHFDGYELSKLVEVPLLGNTGNMRGVYIDGYMYMFGQNDFKVTKVFN